MAGKLHSSNHMSFREKRKRRYTMATMLAVCLMVFVALVGTAFGKYQHQLESEDSVRAQEFYFTSDFLDGSTHALAPGSTSVEFSLGNHADELRYSEVDVAYAVTVTPDGDTIGSPTVNPSSGTLQMNQKSDENVTISNLQPGTYTVTVVGRGGGSNEAEGYEKTLTAVIEVLPDDAKIYQHTETVADQYSLLTVWNEGDAPGNVFIEYKGIPDNTNPNMTGWSTGGDVNAKTGSIEIEPHESKEFRFFDATYIDAKQEVAGGAVAGESVAQGTPK